MQGQKKIKQAVIDNLQATTFRGSDSTTGFCCGMARALQQCHDSEVDTDDNERQRFSWTRT